MTEATPAKEIKY